MTALQVLQVLQIESKRERNWSREVEVRALGALGMGGDYPQA